MDAPTNQGKLFEELTETYGKGKEDPTWDRLYDTVSDLHTYHYDGGIPNREVVDDATEAASLMSEEIRESKEISI